MQAAGAGPQVPIAGLGAQQGVHHLEGSFEIAVLEVFPELRQAGAGYPAREAGAGLFQQQGTSGVAGIPAHEGLGPEVGAKGVGAEGCFSLLPDGLGGLDEIRGSGLLGHCGRGGGPFGDDLSIQGLILAEAVDGPEAQAQHQDAAAGARQDLGILEPGEAREGLSHAVGQGQALPGGRYGFEQGCRGFDALRFGGWVGLFDGHGDAALGIQEEDGSRPGLGPRTGLAAGFTAAFQPLAGAGVAGIQGQGLLKGEGGFFLALEGE